MKSAIVVELTLPANVHRNDGWWIATCPVLDVCSQGGSRDEAMVNLEDAVVFFVESCVERGTLFEVLREAGFERVSEAETEPPAADQEDGDRLSVRVPLPFMVAKRSEPRDSI
jgi:predicted RNase H-like HicB family nuclease